jgi:hypothetical protein
MKGGTLKRPDWINRKLAIVGLNHVAQPDAKVNLAALEHGQRAGADRLNQLHCTLG